MRDLVTPVNEISGRSHLRSAALGHFDVLRTRTKLGSRAFSVAGPAACINNDAHRIGVMENDGHNSGVAEKCIF